MKTITLSQGYEAIIDDEDHERVSKHSWHILNKNKRQYARCKIKGKTVQLHRFLLNPPSHLHIDHIDGSGLNNQKANLRLCTNQQNCCNQRKRAGTTSIYKGINWHKATNKWVAQIGHNYKRLHLGLFNTELEAALAYDAKALELFGQFARLNDITLLESQLNQNL